MINMELWKRWEGRVVDRKFPLRQWLGGSEHSTVFLTELDEQKSRAAIKLIPAEGRDTDRQLSLWRSAARLAHPHLIRLLEMGRSEFDGTSFLYLVMEYAEEDLSQILPQRALTAEETSAMMLPVLEALSYLHEKGYVHGHIRPSNVLAADNQLKVSTDALSSPGDSRDQTRRLTVYDAPELATGAMTPAADVWSLGVTLVATFMQHPPADGGTDQKNMGVPDAIPEPFRGIARACLRKVPKLRCSIADIRAQLKPMAPAPPITTEAPPESKRSSARILIPAAVFVIVVALFAGPKLFTHHDDAPAPVAETKGKEPEAVTSAPSTPPRTEPAKPEAAKPAPVKADPVFHPKPAPTARVEVTHQVLPEVPKSARNTITGTIKVVVRVDVDASGKVTAATLPTPGPSKYFAGLALKAARQWEFTPREVNGQAASSAWNLRFQFKRNSTQAFPSQVSTH